MKRAALAVILVLGLGHCAPAPAYNHTDPNLPGTDDPVGACDNIALVGEALLRNRYDGKSERQAVEDVERYSMNKEEQLTNEFLVAQVYAQPLYNDFAVERLHYGTFGGYVFRACLNYYESGHWRP
tara:strand:- start:150 stop:527 length:378 start_codon:yes stop_codon:yes gene_type:complete